MGQRHEMTKRRGQRGAAAVLMLGISLLLVGLLMVSVILSEIAFMKQERQNAADAVSMAATQIIERGGVQAYQAANNAGMLGAIARENVNSDNIQFELYGPPTPTGPPDANTRLQQVQVQVQMSEIIRGDQMFGAAAMRAVLPGANPRIRADSIARVQMEQMVMEDVDFKTPELVMVLDFSGSMQSGDKIGSLRRASNIFLDQVADKDILIGSVAFHENVVATTPIQQDGQHQEIRNLLNMSANGPATNYEASIAEAHQMLRAMNSDNPKNILFITDGSPTTGGNGVAQGNAAKADDIQVISLFVGAASAQQQNLLRDIASPGMFADARNEAELNQLFGDLADLIFATLEVDIDEQRRLACVAHTRREPCLYVSLRPQAGAERLLTYTNDIAGAGPNDFMFTYLPDERAIQLSDEAYHFWKDNRNTEILVRMGGTGRYVSVN